MFASAAVLPAAHAHVALDVPTLVQGAYYRAAFKVGHGGERLPTVRMVVSQPEGVLGAKPMPKPGWQLSTANEKLARPVTAHGRQITERVARVVWSGGSLPNAFYDELVMQFQIMAEPGPLWFPVEQVCEKGRNAWTEIPAAGQDPHALKFPAAALEVIAPGHDAAHHH